MKYILWWGVFLCLVSLAAAENLYQMDFLEVLVGVEGELELTAEGGGAKISSAKAELYLYPENSFRQKLLNWNSDGEVEEGRVLFEWKDGELGKKEYGFEALVRTENKRIGIDQKVFFPLLSRGGYENYLEATATIDKDNLKVIEKAAELAEGEDDLFKVVFKLASWVEGNIDYDLNTLTAETSQKASWVLEQREGVCDEMTSLFIAMCRALGIPARFVSGVSYTTSELFEENWLPHGWAEVYFPGYGWVGFDITFGEYGYVDVTHIKLRDGFDPSEASTKFEWLAQKVQLTAEDLKFSVKVKEKGDLEEEKIFLTEEILGKEVGLGSYNLIKGVVKNKERYYAATTLKLAVPKEIEVVGGDKKAVLLGPGEEKEVFWLVKVKGGLQENYWYDFPAMIYSEKNSSVEEKFRAVRGGIFYSKEEAERLVVKDGGKEYSRKIDFDCKYDQEMLVGEKKEVSCVIRNKGNVNLREVNFCLGEICRIVDLPINQEEELKIKVEGKKAGWQKLVVRADDEEVEKKLSLEYVVLDEPLVLLETEAPEMISYKEDFEILLKLKKDSFSIPQEVKVFLKGANFENWWEMEELRDKQDFLLELNSKGFGKENELEVRWQWKNKKGERLEKEKRIVVKVEGKDFWEKMIIQFNGIINFFG